MKKLRSHGAALIISWHDFEATKNLDAIYDRILPFQPDFVKIVSTAKTLSDNVTIMRFLERSRDEANLIGICMGEQGVITRVLGLRAGSVFTFASATAGEETGPGQIAARTLRRNLSHRPGRPVHQGLRRRRQSRAPLALAAHYNMAFRRETVNAVFLAAANHTPHRPAHSHARSPHPRHRHHHAAQDRRS